jgi:uncharacterized protein DUF6477
MQPKDVFRNFSRPKILLQAAQIGQQSYLRNRDLKRLLGVRKLPQPEQAVERLVRRETALEDARKNGNAAYDMKLHVQIMTALLQEMYLLP